LASIEGAEIPLDGFGRHPLILGTLLAALFVRALVPDGFMPAQGELVELCTLHGPRLAMADPLTGDLLEIEEEQAAPPCPFSLLLTTLATPAIGTMALGETLAEAPPAIPAIVATTRSSLALPPARAPPSTRRA
jgi:hypothetical protein